MGPCSKRRSVTSVPFDSVVGHGQVGWMPRLPAAGRGGEDSRPCNYLYISRKPQPCLSRLNGMGGELHSFDIRRNAVLITCKVRWSKKTLEFPDGKFCR